MSDAPQPAVTALGALANVPGLRHHLRLVGVAGANKLMAGELSRIVRRAYSDVRVPEPEKEGPGAVSYPFDLRMAVAAVKYQRTAARALWELARVPARRLEELYQRLFQALCKDERAWCWDGATLSVMAFGVQEFPAGERQVVGTVKNAIIDSAAQRGMRLSVSPQAPQLTFDVRLVNGEVSLALDLAGRPLHQRGYRQVAGAAPLREDLAALLVMLTRHDSRNELLLDPMAGSGTLGIEAALLGQGQGLWCGGRTPRCAEWPLFSSWFEEPTAPLFGDTQPWAMLNEASAPTLNLAQQNAHAAGVDPWLQLCSGPFQDLSPSAVRQFAQEHGKDPARGVILCNPPYGERLQDAESVRPLYRALGNWCRLFTGWRAGFLVANPDFEGDFGQRPRVKKPLKNGPLNGMFYLFEL